MERVMGLLLLLFAAAALVSSSPSNNGGPVVHGPDGAPLPGGNPNLPPAVDVPPYDPGGPMGNGKPVTLTFEGEATWSEADAPWGCQWVKVPGVAYALTAQLVRIEVSVWAAGQWSRDGGTSWGDDVVGRKLIAVVPTINGTIALPKEDAGQCGGQGLSFQVLPGLRILPRAGGGFEVWLRAQGWKSATVTVLSKVGPP